MTGIRLAHITTVDLTLRFLLLGQLRHLRESGFEVSTISAPGRWGSDLEREGIRHIPWPSATRSWNPAADIRSFRELLGILRRERFDVVHTHNPKPGVMGRVAARVAGVPCIVNTVHGLYATPEDRLGKRFAVLGLEGAAARCSDLEMFQSEEDLEWARRRRVVSRQKSLYLGNGIDLSAFDPARVAPARVRSLRAELAIPDGSRVVGMVGRLVAEKGYLELFAAAEEVRRVIPDAIFLCLGDPDPEKVDSIRPEELAGRSHLRLPGWRTDIRDLLGLMDVFVLPSWREGLPRSAIEAAAMGRAMVLTDIRGCREVVRDGKEGLLIPPRNPTRLAGAILTMLGDRALAARFGRAAQARALERFDERKVAEKVEEAYRRLLQAKGIASPPVRPVDSLLGHG
ncbi:MAG: glycosyltransferase family 4 protein [Actinomycetota bacterium]